MNDVFFDVTMVVVVNVFFFWFSVFGLRSCSCSTIGRGKEYVYVLVRLP